MFSSLETRSKEFNAPHDAGKCVEGNVSYPGSYSSKQKKPTADFVDYHIYLDGPHCYAETGDIVLSCNFGDVKCTKRWYNDCIAHSSYPRHTGVLARAEKRLKDSH